MEQPSNYRAGRVKCHRLQSDRCWTQLVVCKTLLSEPFVTGVSSHSTVTMAVRVEITIIKCHAFSCITGNQLWRGYLCVSNFQLHSYLAKSHFTGPLIVTYSQRGLLTMLSLIEDSELWLTQWTMPYSRPGIHKLFVSLTCGIKKILLLVHILLI